MSAIERGWLSELLDQMVGLMVQTRGQLSALSSRSSIGTHTSASDSGDESGDSWTSSGKGSDDDKAAPAVSTPVPPRAIAGKGVGKAGTNAPPMKLVRKVQSLATLVSAIPAPAAAGPAGITTRPNASVGAAATTTSVGTPGVTPPLANQLLDSSITSTPEERLDALEAVMDGYVLKVHDLKQRIRQLEKGKSENRGKDHSWTWKAFKDIGNEMFAIMRKPHANKEFVNFVVNGEEDLIDLPPLRYRFGCIRNLAATKHAYKALRHAVKRGEAIEQEGAVALVTTELVAIFMVSRDGYSPVDLKTYLAVAEIGLPRVRSLPESSFKDIRIRSSVSDNMRATIPQASFFIKDPMDIEWAIGELFRSSGSYHDMLTQKNLSATRLSRMNQTVTHASVTEVASAANTRPATRVSHVYARPTVTQPARPAGLAGGYLAGKVTGTVVDMTGRCIKCTRYGHRHRDCTDPLPSFKPTDPFWLLNEISHGRASLPP